MQERLADEYWREPEPWELGPVLEVVPPIEEDDNTSESDGPTDEEAHNTTAPDAADDRDDGGGFDDAEEERAEMLYAEERKRARREISTTDAVRAYLLRIGKVALLTAVEEVDLAKRIEAGVFAGHLKGLVLSGEMTSEELPGGAKLSDLGLVEYDGKKAKEHLLEANLRLVVSLAKRYTGRGVDFLDLIQEGNLGLNRAVEKFDYAKGNKFSTYATWWIRQTITRGLADQSRTIRVPVHMHEDMNKLGRIQRETLQDLGRPATTEELAAEMGVTVEKVEDIISHMPDPISLDKLVSDDSNSAGLGGFIEDGDSVDPGDMAIHSARQRDIKAVLATLGEREQGVITMRFGLQDGEPKTLDQIKRHYGLSRERIRQIEKEAMAKLRGTLGERLSDYAE